MKHIKTASDAETSMRKQYPIAGSGPIEASESHMASIEKILDLTRKLDLLKLEISKEVGSLMGYMQDHPTMINSDGIAVVSWKNASDKKIVDYDALLVDLNVPPAKVNEFTSTKPGSRIFTILDD